MSYHARNKGGLKKSIVILHYQMVLIAIPAQENCILEKDSLF